MEALTPAERRGALVVLCLLALGTGRDLWRATRPLPRATPAGVATGPPAATFDAETPRDSGAGDDTAPESRPALDLNRATAEELDALPGIGPVLAERIVAHRRAHGSFGSREELLAVRGIGPRLLARLGARVRVGTAPTLAAPDSVIPTR